MRVRGKRPGPGQAPPSRDPEELPHDDSDEELIPAERPQVRARASSEPQESVQAGHWCEDVADSQWEHEPSAFTGKIRRQRWRSPLSGLRLGRHKNTP